MHATRGACELREDELIALGFSVGSMHTAHSGSPVPAMNPLKRKQEPAQEDAAATGEGSKNKHKSALGGLQTKQVRAPAIVCRGARGAPPPAP